MEHVSQITDDSFARQRRPREKIQNPKMSFPLFAAAFLVDSLPESGMAIPICGQRTHGRDNFNYYGARISLYTFFNIFCFTFFRIKIFIGIRRHFFSPPTITARRHQYFAQFHFRDYLLQHVALKIVAHVKSDTLKAQESPKSQAGLRLQQSFQKISRCWRNVRVRWQGSR